MHCLQSRFIQTFWVYYFLLIKMTNRINLIFYHFRQLFFFHFCPDYLKVLLQALSTSIQQQKQKSTNYQKKPNRYNIWSQNMDNVEKKSENILRWSSKTAVQKQGQKHEKVVILSNGEGIYNTQATCKNLLDRHIYSKMIGVNSSSRNITEFVCQPYLIDKYSCAFAINNNIFDYNQQISNKNGVQIMKSLSKDPLYKAYQYLLKEKQLFLIDGHKFGGDFLAYQLNPDSNHAVYIVFVHYDRKQYSNLQISRLAGTCKKIGLVITVKMDDKCNFEISQNEIQPRILESKKNPTNSGTPQLRQLKRQLGFEI